ncbi:MAG: Zn-dependent exopeptidase M28 [Verrucomicrobiae bacterium]|nr:Zn-dependent exopeptidase M28 [Verrucomicrobiae bacterium]
MSRSKVSILAGMIIILAIVIFLASSGGLPGSSFTYDPAKAVHSQLSGAKALAHVQALVDIGPRPSGSEANARQRDYIIAELKKVGWTTREDAFTDKTSRGPIDFVNLHARLGDGDSAFSRTAEVLVGSHFDTKYMPGITFVGANDGGSSTGLLIEMARVLAANPDLAKRIELVFFDGEEAITSFQVEGLHGSKHLAKKLRTLPEGKRPPYAIIFDMIGDKNLNIGIPSNTDAEMSNTVLVAAEELGTRKHFSVLRTEIIDDHQPLHEIGMRVTNFIDLDYKPYWHTSADTMDRITAESIEITGRTGLLFIEKYLLGGGGRSK